MRRTTVRVKVNLRPNSQPFRRLTYSYTTQSKHEEVIFSGIQPTGVPHVRKPPKSLSARLVYKLTPFQKAWKLFWCALAMGRNPKRDRIDDDAAAAATAAVFCRRLTRVDDAARCPEAARGTDEYAGEHIGRRGRP